MQDKFRNIREFEFNDITHFAGYVNRFGDDYYFRGNSKESYQLVPSLGRNGLDWQSLEEDLVKDFSRYGGKDLVGITDDQIKVIAQHHGLPTRLLDWTNRFNIALFFASAKDFDCDGVVYCIHKESFEETDSLVEYDEPIHFYKPSYITPRINVQEGCFTYHQDPKLCLAEIVEEYNSTLDEDDPLRIEMFRIIVKKELKKEIVSFLDYQNINYYKLFPGFDGISKYLEWKYVRRDNE